jgi:hypothetical protein
VVDETRKLLGEPLLVPTRVALRPEENRALVVIHPVNAIPEFAGEIDADFRANQAGGTGDEKSLGHEKKRLSPEFEHPSSNEKSNL